MDRCDGLGYLVAALDVMLAMREGRLTEAEELAGRCYALGIDVGDADALGWYGAQLVAIRWLQGRGEDVLPLLGDLVTSPTVAEPCSGFVAAVAALAAATGDHPAARTALASLRAEGLAAVPPSSIWSATMLGACDAAYLLGDAEAAGDAYELLEPYADRPVMASLAVACFGSAHRPLGLAALTFGDVDLAVKHLEAAVVADLAVGNRPGHAIDRATLADVLDRRRRPGDAERAAELRRAGHRRCPPLRHGGPGRPVGAHQCARRWWRRRVQSRRPGLARPSRRPGRRRSPLRGHGLPGRADRTRRCRDRGRPAVEWPCCVRPDPLGPAGAGRPGQGRLSPADRRAAARDRRRRHVRRPGAGGPGTRRARSVGGRAGPGDGFRRARSVLRRRGRARPCRGAQGDQAARWRRSPRSSRSSAARSPRAWSLARGASTGARRWAQTLSTNESVCAQGDGD